MKAAPFDFFAWAASLHFHQRDRANQENTLMWQIARLYHLMVNHTLPTVIYFLMVVGGLTALNKIPEAEQEILPKRPGSQVPPSQWGSDIP